MNWTELLKEEMKAPYAAAAGLVKLVDDSKLGWKPATGTNWLTTGQLLLHLATACGAACRGFVTGDWKDEGVAPAPDGEKEGMLPKAERYLSVKSVDEALRRLEADHRLAIEMVDRAGEKDLAGKKLTPPWGGPEMILGRYLLLMIDHLKGHKSQLFYYLKLQGKPVDTRHYYGM